MKTLSVVNQKGGTGKSTITILLACMLSSEGKAVAILDCDTQQTIFDLSESEEKPIVDVFQCTPKDVPLMLKQLEEVGCAYCFVDLPRFTTQDKNAMQALFLCDAVFIPTLGGLIEILSVQAFIKGLDIIKKSKPKFKYYAFINRISRKKEDQETKEILEESKVPVMKNAIKDLKIFRNPSLTTAILTAKNGKQRFGDFYKEFKGIINKLK